MKWYTGKSGRKNWDWDWDWGCGGGGRGERVCVCVSESEELKGWRHVRLSVVVVMNYTIATGE